MSLHDKFDQVRFDFLLMRRPIRYISLAQEEHNSVNGKYRSDGGIVEGSQASVDLFEAFFESVRGELIFGRNSAFANPAFLPWDRNR